ncbi:hypothetical protein F383_23301 [Gossypium arboreum]|uniref:Uncharacterized protein n=1 Tax=Gossypium arboreum TaxID=29729 RepID=A0A0B0NUI7_GOSAR|nr:hypothetical protein F383_23301 [Gossypium arboreum]
MDQSASLEQFTASSLRVSFSLPLGCIYRL